MATAAFGVYVDTLPARPRGGMEISSPDFNGSIWLDSTALGTLARSNSKTVVNAGVEDGFDGVVRKLGPQTFLKKGIYPLRPALYLYVAKDNWANAGPESQHDPNLALVESAHPLIAADKAMTALVMGQATEGVVPLSAFTYHHLISQRAFYEDMSWELVEDLRSREPEFNVSMLSSSDLFIPGGGSLRFSNLTRDFRPKLPDHFFNFLTTDDWKKKLEKKQKKKEEKKSLIVEPELNENAVDCEFFSNLLSPPQAPCLTEDVAYKAALASANTAAVVNAVGAGSGGDDGYSPISPFSSSDDMGYDYAGTNTLPAYFWKP